MSEEEAAFWGSMQDWPDDARIMSVFADWLDEHGRPLEAEAFRLLGECGIVGDRRASRLVPGRPLSFRQDYGGYWGTDSHPDNYLGDPKRSTVAAKWQSRAVSMARDSIHVRDIASVGNEVWDPVRFRYWLAAAWVEAAAEERAEWYHQTVEHAKGEAE